MNNHILSLNIKRYIIISPVRPKRFPSIVCLFVSQHGSCRKRFPEYVNSQTAVVPIRRQQFYFAYKIQKNTYNFQLMRYKLQYLCFFIQHQFCNLLCILWNLKKTNTNTFVITPLCATVLSLFDAGRNLRGRKRELFEIWLICITWAECWP